MSPRPYCLSSSLSLSLPPPRRFSFALLVQISALAGTSVVVHPLVLLSVVDHASRSPTTQKKRVLGVLLGQNDGKTVNVANSFAVSTQTSQLLSQLCVMTEVEHKAALAVQCWGEALSRGRQGGCDLQ
jgi:hypothetical protein